MTGSFLITFREGLEAFLVVGVILTYLSRAGLSHLKGWIFLGSGLALISAFILALVFQLVLTGFDDAIYQLYVKLSIMGVAVVMLSYVLVWMAGAGQRIKHEVEHRVASAVGAGNVIALSVMAYLAILREGFETALFLGALYGSEMNANVFYGGVAGVALSLILTVSLFKGLRTIPLKLFFKFTSALILLVAAGILVNFVGVLHDLSLITALKVQVADLRWLLDDGSDVGIFFKALFGYTAQPSLLQVIAYVAYTAFLSILIFRTSGINYKREPANAP